MMRVSIKFPDEINTISDYNILQSNNSDCFVMNLCWLLVINVFCYYVLTIHLFISPLLCNVRLFIKIMQRKEYLACSF